LKNLVKIIIKILAITSRKKWLGILAAKSIGGFALNPPSPRVYILAPPPIPLPPSSWRSSPYRDSDASNPQPQIQSRPLFSSSLYAVISPHHQGNKSFVPFSNLNDVDSLTKTWKVLNEPASDSHHYPPPTNIFALGLYKGRQLP